MAITGRLYKNQVGQRLASFAVIVVIGRGIMGMANGPVAAIASDEAGPLPEAELIIDRVLERAAKVAQDEHRCGYSYEQRTRVEELDGNGQVTKTTEKTYRVELIQGLPFSRLVKIEGKELSPEELRKENEREEEFRRKLTARDFKSLAQRKETWVTRDLLDRYSFVVHSREMREGRGLILLEFHPQPIPLPQENVQDRILSRLTGRLWVDETDAEVARIEVRLLEGFSLGWLGILGSVQQCFVQLERQREPEGCWVNSSHFVHLVGRKLLKPMRLRSTAYCTDFRRIEPRPDAAWETTHEVSDGPAASPPIPS